MKQNSFRSMLMIVITLTVFIFSAVMTVPAYADGGKPPVVPDKEKNPPLSKSHHEKVSTSELLSRMPKGTRIVVLNGRGRAISLASQDAVDTLATGQVIWCPVGVAPSTLNPLCSGGFNGLGNVGQGQLVDWLDVNDPAKAGVIWIAYNYDSWNNEAGYSITMNGADFASLDNFALTLQGGWSGTNGSTTLNLAQPYSNVQVPFTITNWSGAITINNLDFSLANFGGPSDQALEVETKGAITLGTVNVVLNGTSGVGVYDGALLDNTSSTTGATVTIKNSTFDQNEGYGLHVLSQGVVTINNITANGNGADGAFIDNRTTNTTASGDKAVIITGIQQFNDNTIYGLYILSDGAVTLANLVADNNLANSVIVNNITSTGNQGVTIKGVNQFNNNTSTGLTINSKGVITLNSITANSNGVLGAYVDNYAFSTSPKAVTLTGTNIFNGNGTAGGNYGLVVQSLGAITVSNVTASNNVGANQGGVYLNNMLTGAVGGVTLNGYGTFENNTGYGLQIFSKGAILLNNINSNKNGFGAVIDNCGPTYPPSGYPDCANVKPLTLKGTNNFNGNTNYGLEALSGGAITASNVTANNNGSAESYYDVYNTNAPKIGNALFVGRLGITLTGVNTFNNDTSYQGVSVESTGKITISNLNANGNFGNGAYLSGGAGVAVTLTGVNTFNDNGGYGLWTDENFGTVTLNNVTANGNAGVGAYIQNDYVNTTPWNVTLLGTNQFSGNLGGAGLNIKSFGTVLLNNITANYNTSGDGLIVDNKGGLASMPKAITLTGFNNFNNNYVSFDLQSLGVITTNNITADGNTWYGAFIENDFGIASAASPGVFILGTNSFSNNYIASGGYSGLDIWTHGVVTLNNISANNNTGYGNGVVIDNSGGILKAVTITGVNNFNGNTATGLYISASGVVTLSSITANDNDPSNALSGSGIYVTSAKAITLTCGSAYNNGVDGIYLHSTGGLVTINGAYSFLNGTANYDLSLPKAITYPCLLP